MAKQMMPLSAPTKVLPKLIGIAVVIALMVVVVKHPGDSADWVQSLLGFGETVVDGIASFLHRLLG